MTSFWRLTSVSLQGKMYYRAGFFISMMTPLGVLGGQILLWLALYGNGSDSTEFAGYTRSAMFTYTLFSFFISNLITWSSDRISRDIRSGMVITQCVKPVSLLSQSMASMLGSIIPQGFVNLAVVVVVLLAFPQDFMRPDWHNLPPFLLSLVLAVLLRMLLTHVFALLCFYTTSHLGINWVRDAMVKFFSGAVIPVALFPGWLKTVSYYLPFPFMLQTPLSILLERELPMPMVQTFLVQLLWVGFFLLADKLLYGHIRKNMTVAGG